MKRWPCSRSTLSEPNKVSLQGVVPAVAGARLIETFAFSFGGDFHDIFEVRRAQRPARGQPQPPEAGAQGVALGYRGLDGLMRRTHISFDRAPETVTVGSARFTVLLAPGEEWRLNASAACSVEPVEGHRDHILSAGYGGRQPQGNDSPFEICTDNEQFNDWLDHAAADLAILTTDTPHGLYPYAGRALVLHAVWARRPDHGTPDAVDAAAGGARRADLPGGHPGH